MDYTIKSGVSTKLLRLLEDTGALREVKRLGGSYALILPKYWVEFSCLEIENEDGEVTYWLDEEYGVENGKEYVKYTYPPAEEVLTIIKTIRPPDRLNRLRRLRVSDEDVLELCRQFLKARNLSPDLL